MNRGVLLVDNYDSFTYNLAQAFERLGARVFVHRADRLSLDRMIEAPPRALVISPGPGTPENAGSSIRAVQLLSGRVPVLGVCLGHQAIGCAFGGSVARAPSIVHGKSARIEHDGSGIFAGLPSPFDAGRYHSLVLDESTLPDQLAVCARTRDGLLMAVRHRSHPTFGVQFHPESVLTRRGPQLLANFFALAQEAPLAR
jgi:anthranilate synthase component II